MTGFPIRDGTGPAPDSWIEAVAWFGVVLGITALFAFSTTADAQLRFLVSDAPSYLSAAESPEKGVTFTEEQISRMRWASITSVGGSAFGDERLFCGSITDSGVVESIRLADDIRSSEIDSVSGACASRFPGQDINFFTHSQPGSVQLSEEDRNLETPVPYTCAIGFEMAISPINSRVSGISCYEVLDGGESFVEVPVYAR